MKMRLSVFYFPAVIASACLFSCENRHAEKPEKPTPQVFTPEVETPVSAGENDTTSTPETETLPEEPVPVKRKPMPSVAELKKITPSQEAKRALSNDAMQIFRMKPDAFKDFMKSRIPYYQGKGELKAENDRVRIEVNAREMRVQTPKETYSFPMQ